MTKKEEAKLKRKIKKLQDLLLETLPYLRTFENTWDLIEKVEEILPI